MNAVKYLKETYDLKDDDIFTVMMTIAEQVINLKSEQTDFVIRYIITEFKKARDIPNDPGEKEGS